MTIGRTGSPRTNSAVLVMGCSILVLLQSGMVAPATAAPLSLNWAGEWGSDWNDGRNWSGGVAPTAGVDVIINSTDPSPTVIGAAGGDAGQVTVGDYVSGSLTVNNGGTLTSGQTWLGRSFGGMGAATVTGAGSQWLNNSELFIAYEGYSSAWLNVLEGGKVSSANGYVGYSGAAEGVAIVSGLGSEWTNGQRLDVGGAGLGTLTITNGGKVTSVWSSVGAQARGVGTINVVGNGSLWSNGDAFSVGNAGRGKLNVSEGGYAKGRYTVVGERTGSTGIVTVTGAGSTFKNDDQLYIGRQGSGTLLIENGGTVINSDGYLAEQGGTGVATISGAGSSWTNTGTLYLGSSGTGTLNLGAAAGEVAAEAGTLSAARLWFGANGGDGTLVFNHTGSNYNFATPMSGYGTISQLAGTTVLGGDSSAFYGNTNVTGGTLRVNGRLGGVINVSGGALGGNGTLGTVNVGSLGKLAPGNSIGTMAVSGNLSFASGGVLGIEVNDQAVADRVNVAGTVNIANGAMVEVSLQAGKYERQSDYTILNATGGITGAFGINSDLYFLTPTLNQVGNTLVLSLARNDNVIASLAQTPNQKAVANAMALMDDGALFDSLFWMSPAEAQNLLQQASGETHAVEQSLVDTTFGLFQQNLGGRMGAASENSSAMGYVEAPVPSQAMAAISGATAESETSSLAWLAPVGSRGRIDVNGSVTDVTSLGLTGGYEYKRSIGSADVIAGLAGGYVRSNADSTLSSTRSDTGQVGVYGGWQSGAVRLSGSLAYGFSHSDTDRRITAGGLNLTAQSSAWTQTLGTSLEAAYALPVGESTTVSPLLVLDAGVSYRNGTTETGAGAFNLNIADASWGRLDPGIGVELANEIVTDAGTLRSSASVTLQHAMLDAPTQTMNFAGTAAAFTVRAPDLGRDRLKLGLDLELVTHDNVGLFAGYQGTFSSAEQQHAIRLGANMRY